MELSFWNKFVIWSYTLDSSVINGSLLGVLDQERLSRWCSRIARTFADASSRQYSPPKIYERFLPLFEGDILPRKEQQNFLRLYIKNLQYLIKNAPPLTGEITVYKASSPYPGLEIGKIHQRQFNSSSYRIDMNYSTFLPPGGICCMHRIRIPKSARVLILSPLLSAYPDEAEIILPHSVDFEISAISSMPISVPLKTPELEWKEVQEPPYTLGPIYFHNYKVDCRSETRHIELYVSRLLGA